jgi:hypothetical protein
MTEPIVSIAHIQRRVRVDFNKGASLDDCPFPWFSAAAGTWRTEHARLSNEKTKTAGEATCTSQAA